MTDSQSIGGINIRNTKKPEERRQELIDIAEKLFIEKGYEQTAVSDIVKKAKVAQGTFYYYFKTKEEILDQITEKYITQAVKGFKKISNEKNLNAVEKLVKIFLLNSYFKNNNRSLMKYLHEDKNAHLHLKFERKIPKETIPPLSDIIKQGVKEGVFNTKYPNHAAKAFIGISAMVLQGIYSTEPGSEEFKEKIIATFDFLERILDAKHNLILNSFKEKGGL